MKERRGSPYLDTQANLHSLVALARYVETRSAGASVTIDVGDQRVLTAALSGKQRSRRIVVPLPADAAVKIEPRGEVSYDLAVHYRQAREAIRPESHGLELARAYLDEQGKPKTSFRVGDVVVVRLSAKLADRASHLMVADALPAGFEPINARFVTAGAPANAAAPTWGEYRELHDERADFATEYVARGDYVVEYAMRATSAGTFARPPAVAELMYDPETSARTALDTIVVEVKAKGGR